MKYLYSLLLVASYVMQSQTNLVPNGSFETYTTCPNAAGGVMNLPGWVTCSGGGAAEYFNTCSPQGSMSVPLNIEGYQNAADGVAYIGMGVYVMHDSLKYCFYNEPAGASLITPMIIGQKYFVSFKVALTIDTGGGTGCGGDPGCASNKIGALFSTKTFSNSNPAPRKNFAQVYTDSIITDTTNWTTISGSFIADSAYTFIAIGGFFDSLHTQIIRYYPGCPYNTASQSYYYVDDVRVSTDSLYGLSIGVNQLERQGSYFSVYPNPTNNGTIKIEIPSRQIASLEITDALGQTVYYRKSISSSQTLDLSFLGNGTYIVTLKNNNTISSNKLLINK
jgi:hypothetical protein